MEKHGEEAVFQPNKRFRPARSLEEESKLLVGAVPKSTEYKNKWAVKLFEQWKSERDNTHSSQEYSSLRLAKLDIVEDLDVPLDDMRAESINFWLGKFVQEVRDQKGQRYPGRTLYQIIASLKRYLDGKGRSEINLLSKIDSRFVGLRQILDAEMKDVHREGVKNLKEEKQGFTVEEEEVMWQKGVLGNSTAKMLLHTIYFYNGKIFGLRTGEHRIIRPRDFVVGNNFI